jgi:hypothetical protein
MKSVRTKILATGVATGLLLGLPVAAGADAALAGTASSWSGICANGTGGYCLNDWGNAGLGSQVKMFSAQNGLGSNEGFYFQTINRSNGYKVDGYYAVTPTSNLSWPIDDDFANQEIVQIVYPTSTGNLCVGVGDDELAILTNCNSVSTGTGGGEGTVFVWDSEPNGLDGELISNYATAAAGGIRCLESGSSGSGAEVWLDQPQPGTSWYWDPPGTY